MESETQVQILAEADCISLCTNDIEKGMNLTVFPQLWVNSKVDCAL